MTAPRYCDACGLGLAVDQTTETCPRCAGDSAMTCPLCGGLGYLCERRPTCAPPERCDCDDAPPCPGCNAPVEFDEEAAERAEREDAAHERFLRALDYVRGM